MRPREGTPQRCKRRWRGISSRRGGTRLRAKGGGDQNRGNKVSSQRVKVAVVQASPVVFDRERTLDKVHALAGEAAGKGAQLVLFPEAFVSAYPRGLDFGAVVGSRTDAGREDFRRYWESSVDVPGPAFDHLS